MKEMVKAYHSKIRVDVMSNTPNEAIVHHTKREMVDSLANYITKNIDESPIEYNITKSDYMMAEVIYELEMYLINKELFKLISFIGGEKLFFLLSNVNGRDLMHFLEENTRDKLIRRM